MIREDRLEKRAALFWIHGTRMFEEISPFENAIDNMKYRNLLLFAFGNGEASRIVPLIADDDSLGIAEA